MPTFPLDRKWELRGEAAGSGTGGTSKSDLTPLTGTGKAKMSDAAEPGCLVPNANEHNDKCNALPGVKRRYNQKLVDYCRKLEEVKYKVLFRKCFWSEFWKETSIPYPGDHSNLITNVWFFKMVINEIRH